MDILKNILSWHAWKENIFCMDNQVKFNPVGDAILQNIPSGCIGKKKKTFIVHLQSLQDHIMIH